MKFITRILAIMLIASIAAAQESTLDTADQNGDGKVTTKEFRTYASARLQGFAQLDAFVSKVDADSNGEISASEFEGRMDVLQKMGANSTDSSDQGSGSTAKSNEGPHKVGDKATDFELQGIGKKIKLSEALSKGNSAVVVFSRANW